MKGKPMSERKNSRLLQRGFTLLELVMVIAVMAIIASLGIAKYEDVKRKSAKKVNVANLQSITRAVNTHLASIDQTTGLFDNMESLLDVATGGAWHGTPGQYDWAKNSMTAIPGIYRGPKVASDPSASLDAQRVNNQGITIDLANKLGVYYLTEADIEKMRNAGISTYLLHNYTTGQAADLGLTNPDLTVMENGGPGTRADMSAFYKVFLTNGSPVVILSPRNSQNVYKAFGCDLNLTIDQMATMTDDQLFAADLVTTRLYCFGLGRTATFARKALETVPRCELLGRDYYRNYFLVFKQTISGATSDTITFAGVLDPQGKVITDAQFDSDWGG